MNAMAQSYFAWPANASLTALHLIARVALVLTNISGLSVSYAAAADSGTVSFWVTAAFMTVSLVVFQPLFVVWNKRQLRRSKMVSLNDVPIAQDQLSSIASSSTRIGTNFLKFAVSAEVAAVLGYWIIWGVTIADSVRSRWYHNSNGLTTAMAYSSAATLTCALLHTFFLATQLLQLNHACRARSTVRAMCPHCHHYLDELTNGQNSRPRRGSSPATSTVQAEESQNLLGRDSFNDADSDRQTIIDVAPVPGQETGTCAVTPRVSTSSGTLNSNNAGEASESGTAESDRLMEKIACDLHATTGNKWFSRVMPDIA